MQKEETFYPKGIRVLGVTVHFSPQFKVPEEKFIIQNLSRDNSDTGLYIFLSV